MLSQRAGPRAQQDFNRCHRERGKSELGDRISPLEGRGGLGGRFQAGWGGKDRTLRMGTGELRAATLAIDRFRY